MSLLNHYQSIILIQWPTAVMAKLTLLLILATVAAGNKWPGQRLLTMAFAALFGISGFLAVGPVSEASLVAVVSIVMFATLAASLLQNEGEWRVVPEDPRWVGLALLGYAVAFLFPFWAVGGFVWQCFFSPMGTLPHQTLLALLVLCTCSYPATPRLIGWASCAAALVLAVADLVLAQRSATLLLLAPAGVHLYQLAGGAWQAGVFEDDAPKTARRDATKPGPEPPEEARGSSRKWDLK